MSAVLAIVGGGTTALAIVAIIVLARALVGACNDQRASTSSEGLAVQARFVAEAGRDGALAQAAGLTKENKDLTTQLAATQAQLNAAKKELVDRVQKEILSATPGDAVQLVDQLLAQPIVPPAGGASGSATADHGAASTPAVQPAPAAGAGGPGRGS